MNKEITVGHYLSPLGLIEVVGGEDAVYSICFVDDEDKKDSKLSDPVKDGLQQLNEYFFEGRKTFDFSFSLNSASTTFSKSAWSVAAAIPYGETVSYAHLAREVGNPRACRAVASAMAYNRLLIVIPCHRVIASDGSLSGYRGGVWRKKWLLEYERRMFFL
ncbi:TPA: cysteine methyltransferase [Candidatus Dependentiae bacterium]|nr:MAG: hypothetical protein A2Y17_09780 [Clostridiales bacterium GWF2_38_85]HBL98964.1 cysteine methyltransferase [Candidatus Dependentiae bacterium]